MNLENGMNQDKGLPETNIKTICYALAAIALLIVLQVFVLRWQGRVWWCACHGWAIWVGDTWSSHNSQHVLDPYTFSHILHGVIFCGLTWLCMRKFSVVWSFVVSVALEVSWEILENSSFIINRYREATAALGYTGDSIVNSVSDVACCAMGFIIARYLGLRLSLLLFAVTEIVMAIIYRDNLSLNVLMLLCPIDAVKQWQMGVAS
ncbi:MAG: DUF2585 family protein [bacterium]